MAIRPGGFVFICVSTILILTGSVFASSGGGERERFAPGKVGEKLVIFGTVTDSNGAPIDEAEIRVTIDGKEFGEGKNNKPFETSGDGAYQIEIGFDSGMVNTTPITLDIEKTSFKNIEHFEVRDAIAVGQDAEGLQRFHYEGKFTMVREAGPAFYISAAVLILVFALIAFEMLHRTLAAMTGAVLMLFVTYTAGTFDREYHIISFEKAIHKIDINVIFLLMGMMIIVGVMKQTGVFQWLAYKSFAASKGSVFRLSTILMLVTAVTSAFLDNVTTMLLLTPVTVEIALVLKVTPVAFLIPLALASNIGGTATLIGDPPNIMIGSYAGLTFNEFVIALTPVVAIIMAIHIPMIMYIYRKEYSAAKVGNADALTERLKAEYRITDSKLLLQSSIVLGVVIFFFVAHGVLHMEPSIAALAGAAAILLISKLDIVRSLEREVEWPTLIFFMMLFIVVGACEETGLIQIVADWVQDLSKGNLTYAILLILWISAIMSAIIDNIPFTATMLPVTAYLTTTIPGADGNILYWALALGACLGGNGTVVGASANIVTAGLAEKAGYPISFGYFMKIGIPVTLMSIIVSSFWLLFVMK